MHKDNGGGAEAGGKGVLQTCPSPGDIHWYDDLAPGTDPLIDLQHFVIKHFGQFNIQREQLGPGLVTDAECIAETACNHQQCWLTPALQQRVGGHSGAHFHCRNPLHRQAFARRQGEQFANSLNRRILILGRVLRQQFTR